MVVTKFYFLVDLFEHLNKFNANMQSRVENILTPSDEIMAFNEKLTLWETRVEQKKLTMFPQTVK